MRRREPPDRWRFRSADCAKPRLDLLELEESLEGECRGRRAVRFEMRQPYSGFSDGRDVTDRNPPEREKYPVELLEPVTPLAQKVRVRRSIGERAQLLHS